MEKYIKRKGERFMTKNEILKKLDSISLVGIENTITFILLENLYDMLEQTNNDKSYIELNDENISIEKIVSNIFWKTRDITRGLNNPYITVSKMIKEAIDKYMFIKE